MLVVLFLHYNLSELRFVEPQSKPPYQAPLTTTPGDCEYDEIPVMQGVPEDHVAGLLDSRGRAPSSAPAALESRARA